MVHDFVDHHFVLWLLVLPGVVNADCSGNACHRRALRIDACHQQGVRPAQQRQANDPVAERGPRDWISHAIDQNCPHLQGRSARQRDEIAVGAEIGAAV